MLLSLFALEKSEFAFWKKCFLMAKNTNRFTKATAWFFFKKLDTRAPWQKGEGEFVDGRKHAHITEPQIKIQTCKLVQRIAITRSTCGLKMFKKRAWSLIGLMYTNRVSGFIGADAKIGRWPRAHLDEITYLRTYSTNFNPI